MFIQRRPEMLTRSATTNYYTATTSIQQALFFIFFSPPRLRIFERKTPVFQVLPAPTGNLSDTCPPAAVIPTECCTGDPVWSPSLVTPASRRCRNPASYSPILYKCTSHAAKSSSKIPFWQISFRFSPRTSISFVPVGSAILNPAFVRPLRMPTANT